MGDLERPLEVFRCGLRRLDGYGSDKKLRKAFNYDNTYDFYKIMKMQKTDEKTNSWAIRWYWTNFRKQGLILSPTKSLVSNEGWDGTGIHCGNEKGPVSTIN